MLGLVAMWLAHDAAGPHLVGKAIDKAGRRDWGDELSKLIAGPDNSPYLTRAQRGKLAELVHTPEFLPHLIDGNARGLEAAIPVIERELKLSKITATEVLEQILVRFLQVLDPSLAVAVADYRSTHEHEITQNAVAGLDEKVSELLDRPLPDSGLVVVVSHPPPFESPISDASAALKQELLLVKQLVDEGLLEKEATIQLQVHIVKTRLQGSGSE